MPKFNVGDKVRSIAHPEWGLGVVTHPSASVVVADWENHQQVIPLPCYCVNKIVGFDDLMTDLGFTKEGLEES